MTAKELDRLEANARLPDYGSKSYKPDVVLKLIEHIRALEPRQYDLFDFGGPAAQRNHERAQACDAGTHPQAPASLTAL